MSYRADVKPADLEEAKQIAEEMREACGWAESEGDEIENYGARCYKSGVIDAILRSKGYDVFG